MIEIQVEPQAWPIDSRDQSKRLLGAGIAAGVRDVGEILAPHFPRADDDVNELPDRLIQL